MQLATSSLKKEIYLNVILNLHKIYLKYIKAIIFLFIL